MQIVRVLRYEIAKFVATPRSLFESVFYPLLYMLICAPAIGAQIGDFSVDGQIIPYMYFALPGIMIFNAFSSAQYVGIDMYIANICGELEMILAFPMKRSSIIVGKCCFSMIRSVVQARVFCALCVVFYPEANVYLIMFPVYLGMTALFSVLASALFLVIACVIKSQNAFNVMVNMITMPFMFTSNALYDLKNVPFIIRTISKINPLTYYITAMRRAVFSNAFDLLLVVSVISVLLIPLAVFIATDRLKGILG